MYTINTTIVTSAREIKSYPIVQPTEMDIKNIKAVDKYVRNVHI